jgi:hypothetical protein
MPAKRAPTSKTEPRVSARLAKKHTVKDGNILDAGIAPKGRSIVPSQSSADRPSDHPDPANNPSSDPTGASGDYPDPTSDIEAMDTIPDQDSSTTSTHGSRHRGRGTRGRARGTRGRVRGRGTRGTRGRARHAKMSVQGTVESEGNNSDDADEDEEEDPEFNDELEVSTASSKHAVRFYFFSMFKSIFTTAPAEQ